MILNFKKNMDSMNYLIRKKPFLTWLLVLLCLRGELMAQDTTVNLTMESAIALGLKNSKQLKGSLAKMEAAAAVLQQAKDQRLPDFKVSGSYLRLDNPNIDLKVKSNGSGGSTGNNINVSQAFYGIASISYPIYSGLRIQNGIAAAKFLEMAARLDADHDRGSVMLNTINTYINLFKAKAAVLLVKENLEQSRQRDTDFASLERNGVLARNDLLKAQLQTSNIELSLLDAENNLKLATLALNLLLGLPEKSELNLDSNSLHPPAQIKGVAEYEALAARSRADARALEMRRQAAGAGIRAAKGEYYPSLALTGGYIAADIPGFFSVTNAVNIGVGLQYNLSSLWKTNAKIQEARAKERQVLAEAEYMDDNIKYQVNEAYQAFELSRKKIEVYTKAIEQAKENYKITKNKYDNSLATTTDLLEADLAQLQATLNHAFAQAESTAAYNRLLQAAGLLTGGVSDNSFSKPNN